MRYIILTICVLLFNSGLYAQTDNVSLSFGGGLNSLAYELDCCGKKSSDFGFSMKLGYEHFFNPKEGISTGLIMVNFSTSATLNYRQTIDNFVDEDEKNYTQRTYFNELKEVQKQNILILPAEFVYKIDLSQKLKLNLCGGFFAGFNIKNDFKTQMGVLESRRFYYALNLEIYGDYPQHGLYSESDFNGKYDSKVLFGGIFETDLRYNLSDDLDLKFGFHWLYSFNSQKKESSLNLYNPNDLKYNGVFNSNLTNKVHPFALGFSVGINYRL